MKVGELRKQGFKAIAGDTLTNGLSDSIKLSIGGAVTVNSGYHDDLEIVDLLWRVGSPPDSFRGVAEYTLEMPPSWRPDFGSLSNAEKQYKDDTQCFGEDTQKVNFVDNETANATVKAHVESMRPVFTQAMADDGEFPQIGAKCVYVFIENKDEYIGEISAIDGDACWFKLDDFGYKTFIGKHKFKPVDNRTEKQKAVDAAIVEWPVADKATLELAYDLWVQKIEQ